MKRVTIAVITLGVIVLASAYYLFARWAKTPGFNVNGTQQTRLYIYPHSTWEQVVDSIEARTSAPHAADLKFLLKNRQKQIQPRVGSYTIEPNETTRKLYNRLKSGLQSPIMLTINSVRLPGMLWRQIGRQVLIDSTQIAHAMNDTQLLESLGVQDSTLAYHILPNSYEVYWQIAPEELVKRLVKESQAFWTEERLNKASVLQLTPAEVVNLAAIVQEESAKEDEYPMIAGLYLNRLRSGMRLQADPTVKFALQDFGLRRILHKHLTVDNPYNTYLYVGLPPGPIRIPSISAIDGVLNAVDHNYIYMCAKSDFSGRHAFASTYSEHLKNARAYSQALDERNI